MSADTANEKPSVQALEESFSSQNKDKVEVDTVHNDEALKIIAEEHGSNEWDPSEEKRLVRKIDWKLLPLLCLTLVWLAGNPLVNRVANHCHRYGLQYYDKAMLSQAVRTYNSIPDVPRRG